MKILLLPFHFKVFFSGSMRVSGVDECMLKQYRVLSKDNIVKVFLSYSDIQDPNFVIFSREHGKLSNDKQKLMSLLTKTIQEFKPDVILSNHGFNNSLYTLLSKFNTPIFKLHHCLLGQPADVFGAEDFSKFLSQGHSLGCVSEFHKKKITDYYSSPRSVWKVQPNVLVDSIVPSSYAIKKEILPGIPKTVRHVGACNAYKGTFIPHKMAADTDLVSHIFTTVKHVGGSSEEDYMKKSVAEATGKPNLITEIDVPHAEIMKRIKDSAAFFVAKEQSDTFSITSIEALQCGIPLLIYGEAGVHPASNFVEPEFRRYIRYFKTRAQFYDIVTEYSAMTLEDRKALSNSCVSKMGEDNFRKCYTEALEKSIEKYKSKVSNNLESFF